MKEKVVQKLSQKWIYVVLSKDRHDILKKLYLCLWALGTKDYLLRSTQQTLSGHIQHNTHIWTLKINHVQQIVSLPESCFRRHHNKINNLKIQQPLVIPIFTQMQHRKIWISTNHTTICCILPYQQFWFLNWISFQSFQPQAGSFQYPR